MSFSRPLALARVKAARGILDAGAFAEREHSLLTLMAVARHAFTARIPGGSELTRAPWASSASAFTSGGTSALSGSGSRQRLPDRHRRHYSRAGRHGM